MLKTFTIKTIIVLGLLLNVKLVHATDLFPNRIVKDTLIIATDTQSKKHQARADIWLDAADDQISVCELTIGKSYKIAVQQAYRELHCNPSVELGDLGSQKKLPFTASSVLSFTAVTSCMKFTVHSDCKNNIPFQVLVLEKNNTNGNTNSMLPPNLVVDQLFTYQELIEEIFIGGGCFEVSNISLIGNVQGIGHFTSGNGSINIDEGVILASGSINNAPGPNSATNTSTNFNDTSGDPDLDILANSNINDAVGIEFDFTPTVGQISFDYVFASEEYCDYVNSTFNDVFGFFISGPGLNGGFTGNAENIALIPGTTNNVSINNVNIQTNTAYYVDNVPLGQNQFGNFPCTQDLAQQGAAINDCEYDGFTTVLTAVANVIPCETYHIRLVVADVGDGIYDSAVFLAANSFDAGGAATVSSDVPGVDGGIAYEGCLDGFFLFERVDDSDLSQDLTINFTISPSSTATEGVDYAALPNSVTIPAGQTQVLLPITVFNDFLAEGTESIILELDFPCDCNAPFGEFFIEDLLPLVVTPQNVAICYADLVELTPAVSGGAALYSYQWDSGETSSTLSVLPSTAGVTTHTVTVTDACGTTETASFEVTLIEEPFVTISGDEQICGNNDSADLLIELTGIGPWEIFYAINGATQLPITITETPYTLSTTTPGTYTISSVTASGCPGTPDGTATVSEVDLQLGAAIEGVDCSSDSDGSIDLNVGGGITPYTYLWNNNAGTNEDPSGLGAGTYTVTVTDDAGCAQVDSFVVSAPNPVDVALLNTDTTLCNGSSEGTIDIDVIGGTVPYTFIWNNGVTEEDQTGLPAGTYQVTVTDNAGCFEELSVVIEEPAPLAANGIPLTEADCTNPNGGSIDLTVGGGTGPYTYLWDNGSTTEDLDNLAPGPYLVTITDVNNCTTETMVAVTVNNETPIPLADVSGILTCNTGMVTLDATSSTGNGALSYEWQNSAGTNLGAGATIDVMEAGIYTLLVTDAANGCLDSIPVAVTQDTISPIAAALALDTLSCTTTSVTLDGMSSSNATNYQWYTSMGSPLGTSASIGVNATGTYTLIVINNANGCEDETTVSVDENIATPTAVPIALGILTCDSTMVTLDGTGSSGVGNLTYEWFDLAGSNIGTEVTTTVNTTGNYNLIVTDELNGCTQTAAVNVTEDLAPPVADAGEDGVLSCDTDEVILDGSTSSTGSNIAYVWQNGGGVSLGNTPTISVTEAGAYTLTVENTTNGCTISDEVIVTPDVDLPVSDAGPGGVFNCDLSMITLNGANSSIGDSITYQWEYEDGTPLGNDLTIDATTPGTYYLIVSNSENGCEASSSVALTQNLTEPTPLASPDGILSCMNNDVVLSGEDSDGIGTLSYQWLDDTQSEIGTTATINVTTAGEYELIITDAANGCTAETTLTVNENFEEPIPDIQGGGIIDCTNAQSTLNGNNSTGIGGLAYQWLDADNAEIETEAIVVVEEAGVYTLVITDATNGCTALETIEVMADLALPNVDPGLGGTIDCTQGSIILGGVATSTGTNFNYSWQNEALTLLGTDSTLEVTTEGTYTLFVSNSDNGCTSEASVTVTEDLVYPTAIAGDDQTFTCATTTLTLDGSGSTNGSNINYSWTNGLGVELGTEAVLEVAETGPFTLTVSNTENGCSITDELIITPDVDLPTADAGTGGTINCSVSSITLSAVNSSVGTDITYEWLDEDEISLGMGTELMVSDSGVYTLMVQNQENGCANFATVEVLEDTTNPIADAGPNAQLNCAVNMVTLDASNSSAENGSLSFTWLDANATVLGVAQQLNASTAGDYNVVVTAENGCTAMASVIITEDTNTPIADPGTATVLDCITSSFELGGPNTSTGTNILYQWFDANNVELATTPNLTVTSSGAYTLLVTDSTNQCSAEESVTITDNFDYPLAEPSPGTTLTCDNTGHILSLANSTQGPDITYTWLNELNQSIGTTDSILVTTAGVYTLVVSNNLNSCNDSTELIVAENITAPFADAISDANLDCTTLSAELDASSSSIPFGTLAYAWSDINNLPLGNTAQINVITPGIYQLTVTAENGCTETTSVTVTQDIVNPSVDAGEPGILDCALTSWELGGTSTSIGNNISYEWSDETNTVIGNTPTLTVSDTGTYLFTVYNTDNNCSALDTVIVTENVLAPVADAGADGILNCNQNALTLGGTTTTTGTNISYQWLTASGDVVGNEIDLSIDEPGTYTFVVLDNSNACADMTTVEVTDDFVLPSANAGPDGILTCDNTDYQLNGMSSSNGVDFDYEWRNESGALISNEVNTTVSETGNYTLTVINTINGCRDSAQVNVTPDDNLPTAVGGNGGVLNCAIATVNLDGSASSTISGNTSYVWQNDVGTTLDNVPDIAVTTAGLYTLIITDENNGCTATATVAVTEDLAAPEVEAGEIDTLNCTSTSVNLAGTATGNGNLIYEWFDAQANSLGNQASVSVDLPGTYTLVVTNTTNQCSANDTVAVIPDNNAPIAAVAPSDILNCVVSSVVLDGTASSAGNNITYQWLDAQGGLLAAENTVTVNGPGNYTLLVTDNSNDCNTTEEVVVSQDIAPPIPVIAQNNPLLNCAVSSIVLDASGSQPLGNLNFDWSTANGNFLSGQNTVNPEVNATGSYDLVITNTVNGCTSTELIVIDADLALPQIEIATPPVINCYEPTINLNASNSSSGPSFIYDWNGNVGGIVAGATSLTPMVNQAGTYSLVITNQINACTQIASIMVLEDTEAPVAEAGEGGELNCTLTEIDLDGAGSSTGGIYGYLWSSNNGTILSGATTLTPIVNATGNYQLRVTNIENGCSGIDEVLITENVNLPNDAEVIPYEPICFGDYGSIEIIAVTGGTGPYLYSLDDGQSFYADSIFYNLNPGTYDYTIQDVFGCLYESSIVVPTVNEVAVYLEPEVTLELGDSLQLIPDFSIPENEIDSIVWSPAAGLSCTDCLYPFAKPLETTRYTVKIFNRKGCEDQDDILLRVTRPDGIYIPNAFSPDSDGQNDEFMIYANDLSIARITRFEVFDRWGALVFADEDFQPNDPAHSWDGRFQGKILNPAVFVYWAEVEYIDGTKVLFEGDVTIVR
ncbi:MAG: choice-of-anchor L domain-containing protein [Saprospiraceae bacterium]